MTVNLPLYPAADGPNAAQRLRNQHARYGQATNALTDRLTAVEDALAAALADQDRRANIQDRLHALAVQHRKQARRN